MKSPFLPVILGILVGLWCAGACAWFVYRIIFLMNFYDPNSMTAPLELKPEELVGEWERMSSERLIIRNNFTFKQIFVRSYDGYKFETSWNRWWVEKLSQGGFRLHLEGARNYASIPSELAERGAFYPAIPEAGIPEMPILFWDPFAKELVEMPHKLILQIRFLSSEELILHHLSPPRETIFVGEGAIYRKQSGDENK